tara:strand:- start:906 stop:1529 length:624 start_codon:yes stop_codon:yes gene_type:complete
MAKRFTDTDKWKKGFIRSLSPKFKLLWLYILDDCNHAGIWETDFEVASIRIGSKVTEKEASQVFASQIKIFDNGDKWFVAKFIDFQYGTLNENSRPHAAVIKLLDRYDVYNIEGISPVDVAGMPNEIEKPIIKRFKEPNAGDVADYCIERKNNVDPMKFINFYDSNGWKVGKNKMKDWKACVRSWEANSPKDKTSRKQLDNKDYTSF